MDERLARDALSSPSAAPAAAAARGHDHGADGSEKPAMVQLETALEPLEGDGSPFARLRIIEASMWDAERSPETKRARRGLATDKEMGFVECCRRYPKALAWSLLLLMSVIMMAYDTLLLGGLFAMPVFTDLFGEPKNPADPAAGTEVSPAWQMGLNTASMLAEIVGLMLCGYFTGLTGCRLMMIAALVWTCIGIFPAVFARNLETLLAYQIICGISWGILHILAAMYAVELVPSRLRAFVLSNVNTCWLIGQLVVTGIQAGLGDNGPELAIRFPFALQWAWALVPLVGVFFAPESPWWLVRRDRPDEAAAALRRLSDQDSLDIDNAVALMEHTNEVEKKLDNGGATFAQLFRGPNRRRTEITCIVWVCQALSGTTVTYFAPYLMQQVGFNRSSAFNFSTQMYAVAVAGGILSWFLLQYVGRRQLYLMGLSAAVVFLTAGGVLAVVAPQSVSAGWALGGLLMALTLSYNLTLGPVCYVLVAEIPATRLRVSTVAFARITYNIVIIINNVLITKMLNPLAWDWKGKSCFVYASTSLLCLVWCYFRLPETRKLSYVELDILFELRAPARKFAKFQAALDKTPYVSASSTEQLNNPWHGWLAYS